MAGNHLCLQIIVTLLERPSRQVKRQWIERNNPLRLLKSRSEQLIFAADTGPQMVNVGIYHLPHSTGRYAYLVSQKAKRHMESANQLLRYHFVVNTQAPGVPHYHFLTWGISGRANRCCSISLLKAGIKLPSYQTWPTICKHSSFLTFITSSG